MKKLFKSYLFEGILMIALGIALLVWPTQTNTVLITVVGTVIALVGLLRIIFSIAFIGGKRCILDVIIGLLQMAAGLFLIIRPDLFLNFFPFIIGVILFYGALVLFIRGIIAFHGFMRILAIIFALLLACVAVIIMAYPELFAGLITYLHGIALIIEGVLIIIFVARVSK